MSNSIHRKVQAIVEREGKTNSRLLGFSRAVDQDDIMKVTERT